MHSFAVLQLSDIKNSYAGAAVICKESQQNTFHVLKFVDAYLML